MIVSKNRGKRNFLKSLKSRFKLLAFAVLSFLVVLFYSLPGEKTSGDITFTDGTGSPLRGSMELKGAGISSGLKSDTHSISWTNIPNARIYYDALDEKGISINLRIAADSPKGKVVLENYGKALPTGVNISAPEVPIKYLEIRAAEVSFAEAEILIRYADGEIKGQDEKTLAIYRYEGEAHAWNELPAKIDAANNLLSITVDSLSVFAVSARGQKIEVRDTKKASVVADIRSYDEARALKKAEKTDSLPASWISEKGEVEFDALSSENVAVKLKIDRVSGGEVILDDYGRNNPVQVQPPGKLVKFVEIGAGNISYSSAEVTILYGDAELDGAEESKLVIYHWNGAAWEALSTRIDSINNLLTAATTSLSPFGVSAAPAPGTQLLKLVTNRFVVLDDPSGWVLGTPGAITGAVANQWLGESTTIRWYILVVNSSGVAAPAGVNVTTYLKYPNGTIYYSTWALTDSNGFVNFSKDLDNLNQITTPWNVEGNWSINATATVDSQSITGNETFIYNEYGCGKSGTSCHDSRWNTAVIGPQTASTFGAGTKDSPYLMGWDTIHNQSGYGVGYPHGTGAQTILYGECLTCHKSYNGTYVNASARDNYQPQYAGGLHYTKTNAACTDCHAGFVTSTVYVNMPIKRCYDAGCHPKLNNNLTKLNYTQSATLSYSYFPLNTTNAIRNHTLQNTIPCITCHGDGHNITRPYNVTGTSNNITEYQQCTACHQAYQRHNNSVNCTVCHSQDAHIIKVFAQNATYINGSTSSFRGNCTNCHQNSTFLAALKSQPKAGAYTGRIPIIPNPLSHSSNLSNGTLWNSTATPYWNSSQASSSCYYCHNNTKHNATALGPVSNLLNDPNNTRNGSLAITTWCADCHYNDSINAYYNGSRWAPVPPLITVNSTGKSNWQNHSNFLSQGYKDTNCRSCHALNGSYLTTSLNYTHSLDEGVAGGPACINCHNLSAGLSGGAPAGIDVIAFNQSTHFGMNSANSTANGACWACHDTVGNVTSGHGDKQKTPKVCDDCHLDTGTYYSQAQGWGLLVTVNQHYYNANKIKAGNSTSTIASCINCHENVSEMLLGNVDTDTGSFTGDGIRQNGGNRSFYHYGSDRQDLRVDGSANCYYCHQNSSTEFTIAMRNASANSSIFNHTDNTVLECTNAFCHSTGLIHDDTLNKPSFTNTQCTACHSLLSPSISNSHNRTTVNCWNCHQDPNSSTYRTKAHGMMYPQADGSYLRYQKVTPANCTTCHVYNLVNTSTARAIRVPSLNHSTDTYSGNKWNGSQSRFWDNTSMVTACYYCHQNGLHKLYSPLLGNVSTIKGSNKVKNSNLSSSRWCAACHYNDSTSNYKGNLLNPQPPEILNKSGNVPANAGDGTAFNNHSSYVTGGNNDSNCETCHALNGSYLATSLNYSHSLDEGVAGGANCIACHDLGGSAGEGRLVDFAATNDSSAIHKNLNSGAATSLSSVNKKCWACHGNGNEPGVGHPANYKNPKNCNYNDCHSLAQSRYNESMVYSHFRNASLNGNSGNATNYNITAAVPCEICHVNSLVKKYTASSLSHASHYGSKADLVDSFNCIYCHLDKDNSEDWGNATLINKNRTLLVELDRERNKTTVFEGESIHLGEGYFLKLMEVSQERNSALIQIIKNNSIVDETLLGIGTLYKYEIPVTIDNATFKTPVITLNMTAIFRSAGGSFIQFEAFRIKRLHKESKNSACFACHLYRYSREKERYIVIDRESREDPRDDIIYYTKVLVDFKSENKSKIYYLEEDYFFTQLESIFGKYLSFPHEQKYLREGENWNISDNYSLKLNSVSIDREASLTLTINNNIVEEQIVGSGSEFKYTPGIRYKGYTETNVTVFTAKIASISQARPNFVVLRDVVALSPVVAKITADTTLFGYNGSWLKPDNVFTVAKIPESLHSPNLYDDLRTWADCVQCHDSSANLRIPDFDAISSRLGKHSGLNMGATNRTFLSDGIDRVCWACHADGAEPQSHSPTYSTPRRCESCHTYREKPSFGAIDISDEPHGYEPNCESCHIMGSHNLVRFEVSPVINEGGVSKTTVSGNETIKLAAEARAGYKMKIRGAEYFLDEKGEAGNGTPLLPLDGSFDSQNEKLTAEINTTGMSIGLHRIYIHAKERDNRWGDFYTFNFIIVPESETGKTAASPDVFSLMIVLMAAYLFSRLRRR